jgi:hypothetical protein
MSAIKVSTTQTQEWWQAGIARVVARPALWLGMSWLFLLLAGVLRLIGLPGNPLTVVLAPFLLAGALAVAREIKSVPAMPNTTGLPGMARGIFHRWVWQPARELFQFFRADERLFGLVIVCILTTGLTTFVYIIEIFVVGGSMLSGLTASSLVAPKSFSLFVGIPLAAALYTLLAMVLFYLVPLHVFRAVEPVAALVESFNACRKNFLPWVLFCAPFFLGYAFILYVFAITPWAGYLMTFTLGSVMLPVFVAGGYASFAATFEPPAMPFSSPQV